MPDNTPKGMVPENKAAEIANLSPKTLRNYRYLRAGPPFVKLAHGRTKIWYKPSEVRSWRKGRK